MVELLGGDDILGPLGGVATTAEVPEGVNTLVPRFRGVVNTVEMLGGVATLVARLGVATRVKESEGVVTLVVLGKGCHTASSPGHSQFFNRRTGWAWYQKSRDKRHAYEAGV